MDKSNLTHNFLKFAWHSLTTGQQDIVCIKYHIALSETKTVKELLKDIEGLELNDKVVLSNDRVRKIKKYEIKVIFDRLRGNQSI